jgi:hypothetical protein
MKRLMMASSVVILQLSVAICFGMGIKNPSDNDSSGGVSNSHNPTQCSSSYDGFGSGCPSGYRCSGNKCLAKSEPEVQCVTDYACNAGGSNDFSGYCDNGICRYRSGTSSTEYGVHYGSKSCANDPLICDIGYHCDLSSQTCVP